MNCQLFQEGCQEGLFKALDIELKFSERFSS